MVATGGKDLNQSLQSSGSRQLIVCTGIFLLSLVCSCTFDRSHWLFEDRDAQLDFPLPDFSEEEEIEPLSGLGQPCSGDDQCESGYCETFGEISICSTPCTDSCPEADMACFEGWCVPDSYCDNSAGEGYGDGPGCIGTVCDACDEHATCVQNPDDSYTCRCNEGYYGDGLWCANIDECDEETEGYPFCVEGAACTDSEGSYTCDCGEGWEGDGRVDGSGCIDVDECDEEADGYPFCVEGATCTNSSGEYLCTCPAGYQGDGRIDGTGCTDIDECDSETDPCGQGSCTNVEGGYLCSCNSGYTSSGEPFPVCTDIDECEGETNPCGQGGGCTNTPGGYGCDCYNGYTLTGTPPTCADVDECEAAEDPCGAGVCTNQDGGYQCACNDGYHAEGAPFPTCVNTDECSGDVNPCGTGFCTDQTPGYTCNCISGYRTSGGQFPTCENIDECDEETHTCGPGTCVDSEGGYLCTCNDGYHAEGAPFPSCVNTNECGLATNPCGHGTCADLTPGYQCTCEDGYRSDDELFPTCEDIDECDEGTDTCGPGTCQNISGGYQCTCNDGYHAEGAPFPSCVNTDECHADPDPCGPGECSDLEPGYECKCRDGYEPVGDLFPVCEDIDECEGNPCGVGDCYQNEPGYGYYCDCPDIYFDNGTTCELNNIHGTLTEGDPGCWADGTEAESCDVYRNPDAYHVYEGATGDGYYRILPPDHATAFAVYCDMTTDGGGWTAVEVTTAYSGFGWTLSNLVGSACSAASSTLGGHAAGNILCRYDIDLGFSFSSVRSAITVTALTGGGSNTSDLTYNNLDWDTIYCGSATSRGDFRIGSSLHAGPVLSMGQANVVSACGNGGSFDNGETVSFNAGAASTTEDTILRIELGEAGPQDEGWGWTAGRIFVR